MRSIMVRGMPPRTTCIVGLVTICLLGALPPLPGEFAVFGAGYDLLLNDSDKYYRPALPPRPRRAERLTR
jgi:hypothetical protein